MRQGFRYVDWLTASDAVTIVDRLLLSSWSYVLLCLFTITINVAESCDLFLALRASVDNVSDPFEDAIMTVFMLTAVK